MKIAVITSLYKPHARGGAEIIAEKVAQGLRARGHQVFVISTGYKEAREEVDGIPVYRVRHANLFNYIDINSQPLWKRAIWHLIDQNDRKVPRRIREIVEEERPDVVLTHALKGLGYMLPRELRHAGVPLVHTLHDIQLSVPSGLLIKGREKEFMVNNPYVSMLRRRNKGLFEEPTAVLSPSSWLIEYYKEYGFFKNTPTEVLRNPIEIPKTIHPRQYAATYTFIGQIEEHKGIRQLLAAFNRFTLEVPEARLFVVGKGRLLDELKEQYSDADWVTFLGFVPYADLPDKVFARTSFSVLPSVCYENSPGLVYDSFANGVPVITGRIGGAAELIKDGENGFTFEAGSEEDLLRALIASQNARDTYESLSARAGESIQGLSLEDYCQRLEDIIHRYKAA